MWVIERAAGWVQLIFSSARKFEFDDLAGAFAVPEPDAWGLTLVGFCCAGPAFRCRRAHARA